MSIAVPPSRRQELGNYLRDLLLKNKLKQSDLAKHLEVSRQYVSLLTKGQTAMSPEHFKRIRSCFFRQKLRPSEIEGFMQRYIDSKLNLQQDLPPTSEDIYLVVQELKKYVNQELVLNRCLELATSEEDYSEAIQKILPTIGEAVNAEYASIQVYDDNYRSAMTIFEWHKDPANVWWQPPRRQNAQPNSPWRKQIMQHKIVHAESTGNLAAQLPECIRKDYLASPVDSMLLGGIWRHQKLFGLLQFASPEGTPPFTEHDERLCASSCRILQLLFERG